MQVPVAFGLATLVVAFIFFLVDLRRERQEPAQVAEPWRTGLSDFLLFFWLVLVALLGGQLLVILAASLFAGDDALPDEKLLLLGSWGTHLPMLGLLFLLKKVPAVACPYPLSNTFLTLKPAAAKGFFYFVSGLFLVGVAGLVWMQLLTWLAPSIQLQSQLIVTTVTETESLFLLINFLLLGVVVAPIWEEVLFRGGIYRYLKGKMPPLLALTLTSLLFALVHFNIASFMSLFALAMLMGRAYERSGNILVPIFFHAFFNLNTFLLLFITKGTA